MTIYDPWRDLIVGPPRDHFAQVYRDDRALIEAVSLFTGAALGRNEAVILVATRAHATAIEQRLEDDGFDVPALKGWGQLASLDAEELLSRFMVEGAPDEARFKAAMRQLIAWGRRGPLPERARVRRDGGPAVVREPACGDPSRRALERRDRGTLDLAVLRLLPRCQGAPGARFPPGLRALHTHVIPVEACA